MGQVDGAVRQTDIVQNRVHIPHRNDLADGGLDQISEPRGFFDPSACLRTHMQDELPAIGIREEILAEPRGKREHGEAANKEDWDEQRPPAYRGDQRAVVSATQTFKSPLEPTLCQHQRVARGREVMRLGPQQIHRHGRHQGARQHVRREHGEHHGFGERHEQVARDAGQQEHRHEHDADAQRGDQGRHGDLRGTFQDRTS